MGYTSTEYYTSTQGHPTASDDNGFQEGFYRLERAQMYSFYLSLYKKPYGRERREASHSYDVPWAVLYHIQYDYVCQLYSLSLERMSLESLWSLESRERLLECFLYSSCTAALYEYGIRGRESRETVQCSLTVMDEMSKLSAKRTEDRGQRTSVKLIDVLTNPNSMLLYNAEQLSFFALTNALLLRCR
jgi:hypothetical protein